MGERLSDEHIDSIVRSVLAERGIEADVLPDEARDRLSEAVERNIERINSGFIFFGDSEDQVLRHARQQVRDIFSEEKVIGFENELPEVEFECLGSYVVRKEIFDQYKSIKSMADQLATVGNVEIESIDRESLYEYTGSDEVPEQDPVLISVRVPRHAVENVDMTKTIIDAIRVISEKAMLGTSATMVLHSNIEGPSADARELLSGVVPGVLEFVSRRYDNEATTKHSFSIYQDINGERLQLDKDIEVAEGANAFTAFGPYPRDIEGPLPRLEALETDAAGFVKGSTGWNEAEKLLFSWAAEHYKQTFDEDFENVAPAAPKVP